jgi:acyl-CoA reductase-like NAD-dependent aldehyde dehydrogenase
VNADLVTELAWQMGRPVRYGGEMGGVRERTEYMAGIAGRSLAPEVIEDDANFRRVLKREPVGVVLVIAPWNYPFLTAINTIVPALIAGNAVVLKHASQTPLAGERLAQAFAHLPEGVFGNVFLDHATTSALLGERAFDFVNFTGSVRGGQEIERAAAGTFVGLGLELGGKDPGYVRGDADLDKAVDVLMDGAMYNSGQCCCGIERIYVEKRLFEPFVEKAVDWVSKLKLGNPTEEATTLGPMASMRFADTVRGQVAEAVAAGAKPLVDPALFPADTGDTAYLAPQVLTGVDHSMRVMTEESFGPVVGIMPVEGDDEAIRLMNDSRYGLTASVWTGDVDKAEALGRRIETGTVFMNRADYLDPALTWTGVKETGRGAALSHLGYLSVTRPKSYHLRRL